MLQLFAPRPDLRSAHIFADHLEATLDLAEEIELLYLVPSEDERAPGRDVLAGVDRIGAFVERIEALELAIAAKLELARSAADRIAQTDMRLSTFTRLFHAGTQPLVDLLPALADPGGSIFESGHDPLTFLRTRGVIDESCCSLERRRFLGTGPDYRLLGTVKLGVFIELCDTCLKALDRHYRIYEDDVEWEADHSRTLEVLRERRDEAIRVALGSAPEVIETPVEIMASGPVDEAIELIEALTFPEEERFEAGPPMAVEPADAPIDLGADAIEEMPIALEEAGIQATPAPDASVLIDLAAAAIIDEAAGVAVTPTQPEEMATEPVSPGEIGATGQGPVQAVRPSLLAPINTARRTLASILARRRAPAVPGSDNIGLPAEPDAVTSTAEAGAAPAATAIWEPEQIEVAEVVADTGASPELTGVRQRLVQLISEQAVKVPTSPFDVEMPAEDVSAGAAEEVLVDATSEVLPPPEALVIMAEIPVVAGAEAIVSPVEPEIPDPLTMAVEVEASDALADAMPVEELPPAAADLALPPAAERPPETVAAQPAGGAADRLFDLASTPPTGAPHRKRPRRHSRGKALKRLRRPKKV